MLLPEVTLPKIQTCHIVDVYHAAKGVRCGKGPFSNTSRSDPFKLNLCEIQELEF